MAVTDHDGQLDLRVREFVLEGFEPKYGELTDAFGSRPEWKALAALGTGLWLDTGDMGDIEQRWTREFTALTTNNTLLNREVQKGVYDELIREAADVLDGFELTEQERKLELAFILNAYHGLRLVERFDAFVSVEEHTDLTHDLEGTLQYARRYRAVCPERFYVKIPFSPEGLLATRKAADEGIPINHTLGFSARQNHLIARIGQPAFVNVFMGRLNSFVADNGLGEGTYVGEKATLASQRTVRELREGQGVPTRQIGASYRNGGQVRDLAGIDVMTVPPKVTDEYLALELHTEDIHDCTDEHYEPALNPDVNPREFGLHTLWEVPQRLTACLDALERQDLGGFTGDRLVEFFSEHGCGDMMVPWTAQQVAMSADEGKIPTLDNWADALASGEVGLGALMNLAGWNAFNADQRAMDEHVAAVLE